MASTYNFLLACFSLFVATLASYTVLEITERISSQDSVRDRRWWLGAGALVLGLGIWSSHFIGMLAFELPIAISYDVVITTGCFLLSLLLALYLLDRATHWRLYWPRTLADGVVLGLGFVLVQYLGIASMQIVPAVGYTTWLTVVAVLLAMLTAILQIGIIFAFNARRHDGLSKRICLPMILGLSIFGLHCLSMAALTLSPDSKAAAAAGMNSDQLMRTVIGTLFILILILIFSSAQKNKLLRKIVGNTNDKLL